MGIPRLFNSFPLGPTYLRIFPSNRIDNVVLISDSTLLVLISLPRFISFPFFLFSLFVVVFFCCFLLFKSDFVVLVLASFFSFFLKFLFEGRRGLFTAWMLALLAIWNFQVDYNVVNDTSFSLAGGNKKAATTASERVIIIFLLLLLLLLPHLPFNQTTTTTTTTKKIFLSIVRLAFSYSFDFLVD